MSNVVLNNPIYKEYLDDFSYSVHPTSKEIVILYKGFEFDTICKTLGYITMWEDSKFTLNVSQELLDTVIQIKNLSEKERETISELFEYLQYECPRKTVKKILIESSIF